ncbi:MAG: TIGR03668 family PPOX class F420-dependent oxidoreductase [Acidimicrobiales bacterium]
MKLSHIEALAKLADHDHGVLCTMHAQRGTDPVPVLYTVVDGFVGVPLDTVKAKTTTRLQRNRNLEADPRAALLIEHWDRYDWSRLWWVRAELRWEGQSAGAPAATLADRLAERFVQYREKPFAGMLVLRIVRVTGWAATDG